MQATKKGKKKINKNHSNKTNKNNKMKNNNKHGELKAIKQLEKREDIIITNTDKGGTVVNIDVIKYIAEADLQLSDTTNFTKSHHHKICRIMQNQNTTNL